MEFEDKLEGIMIDKIEHSGQINSKLEVEVIEIQKKEDEDSDDDSVQEH